MIKQALVSRRTTAVLFTLFLLVGLLALFVSSAFKAKAQSPTFTAVGDYGSTTNTDAVLSKIATAGSAFHLALGDLSYDVVGNETAWCNRVKNIVGQTFPFELLAGNHEDDTRVNGWIGNFIQCLPDRLAVTGSYGAEYYFDYNNARFILASAASFVNGINYDYNTVGSARYNWMRDRIREGKEAGKWVIVGMHKNCITPGTKTCEIGQNFINLLMQEYVDLVLQGHDHIYARSKQLTCATAGSYNAACVADADDQYTRGSGTVIVMDGLGGGSYYTIDPNDTERNYFVKAMSGNGNWNFVTGGTGSATAFGTIKVTVSATQLDVQFVPAGTGTYSDSFSIQGNPPTIFTAEGDYGSTANTDATLATIRDSDSQFSLALGDLSYAAPGTESTWCTRVKNIVGATYAFELLAGNHEDDGAGNGWIGNFIQCLPDRLGVTGTYGSEYYYDRANVRFIMGAAASAVNGINYDYNTVNGAHYLWMRDRIREAKNAGKWVVVGMHKNCFTPDATPCEIGPNFMNLLLAEHADLVFQGHDHLYARSKQLSCVVIGSYNAGCVADADNLLTRGAGTVVVVSGAAGVNWSNVNPSDPEREYFVKAMGGNGYWDFVNGTSSSTGFSFGTTKITLSDSRLDFQALPNSGTFSDSFAIVGAASCSPSPCPTNTPVPTAPPGGTNVVQNGEFDNGTTNWSMSLNGGATGSLAVVTNAGLSGPNALKVTITNGGTADWHVQPKQVIGLTSGKTYQISFMGKADAAKTVTILLQQSVSPYTVYWQQTVNLTTSGATFGPYSYTATATDAAVNLNFNLGGNTIAAYLDKIAVMDTTSTATPTRTNTPVPPTATFTPTNTPVLPTPTRTNTPLPPTATFTPTNTPVPPTPTATSSGINLVQNPEFDNGTTSWNLSPNGGAVCSMAMVTNAGLSGTNALKVTITNGGTADWHVQLMQAISLTSGKTYQISFMGKADAAKTVTILLQQSVSPYMVYWQQTVNLTTSGATFGPYTYTATATGAVNLNINLGGNTTAAYLDKIAVVDTSATATPTRTNTPVPPTATPTRTNTPVLPTATTPPSGTNVVQNGEFDNGTTNWSMSLNGGATGSLAVVTNAGLSGPNALKVTITNGGTADWHVQPKQVIGLTSGKTYQISFMGKADAAKTVTILLQRSVSPFTVYWQQTVNLTTSGATFGPYSYTATATDAAVNLNFNLGGNTIAAYLDKIAVMDMASVLPTGGPGGSWTLKFNDEFNGTTLDTSKWQTCYNWGCTIASHHELQCYEPQNVIVGGGIVRLKAEQRPTTCSNDGQTYNLNYASGMISGDLGYTFTYGYVEIRSKGISGKGFWPALWLVPGNYSWPPEFDIMELLGDTPTIARFNYWYSSAQNSSSYTGPDFSADYHLFGLYWGADSIRWYVDGVERGTAFTDTANISTLPEYFIADLAVGGDWPGAPDASTVFPNYYDIDYVRIWQR